MAPERDEPKPREVPSPGPAPEPLFDPGETGRARDAPPGIGISPGMRGSLRCPYCHTTVVPGRERLATCHPCGAVHHEACWTENRSCASCRAPWRREAVRARTRRRITGVLVLGLVLVGLVAFMVHGVGPARTTPGSPADLLGLAHGPAPQAPALDAPEPTGPRPALAVAGPTTPEQRLKEARHEGDLPSSRSPLGWAQFAFGAAEAGEGERALELLKSAKDVAGDDALAWCRIGESELATGLARAATFSLGRAVSLDPSLSRAQAALANAYFSIAADELAQRHLALAFSSPSPSPLAYTVRAAHSFSANEGVNADADIAAALAQDPDDLDALRLRAISLASSRQMRAAQEVANRALALSSSPIDLELVGALEALADHGDQAAAHLLEAARRTDQVIPLRPLHGLETERPVALARSKAWLTRGDELAPREPALAREAYSRARTLAPETTGLAHEEAELHRALLDEQTGDLPAAADRLDTLVHGGFALEALRARIRVRERLGNLEGLLEDLEDLRFRGPPGQEGIDARIDELRRRIAASREGK